MKVIIKVLKISGAILILLLIILYCLFAYYTSPKSDKKILKAYNSSIIKPFLTKKIYNSFEYRKISILKDTTLPTSVFVHRTIGSVNDLNNYLSDSTLQQKANMVAYDRIGYNYKDKNKTKESILEELPLKKTILVGYSYGRSIALALKIIILLAPAIYSKVEPMPWLLNIYKWKATRRLVPKIWKEASKEKLSHKNDLLKFETNWKLSLNKIVSIHGTKDWIVPFSNSVFLQKQLKLIKIEDVGYELIWAKFDLY